VRGSRILLVCLLATSKNMEESVIYFSRIVLDCVWIIESRSKWCFLDTIVGLIKRKDTTQNTVFSFLFLEGVWKEHKREGLLSYFPLTGNSNTYILCGKTIHASEGVRKEHCLLAFGRSKEISLSQDFLINISLSFYSN
jgi:hypothetical protein